MKTILWSILILLPLSLMAQTHYKTSGGEFIFSRTLQNESFANTTAKTRFSMFLHLNEYYHYNFGVKTGVFSGYSLTNVGFCYENGDTLYKKRAYTLGIPLSLKFGAMDRNNYLFAGGELEFPFHYKQKKIYKDHKEKYDAFFDRRTNRMIPSVFAGMQFENGWCLKMRIYLDNLLNTNFTGYDFGVQTSYRNINSRLFLISLSYNLKDMKIKKMVKKEGDEKFAMLNM